MSRGHLYWTVLTIENYLLGAELKIVTPVSNVADGPLITHNRLSQLLYQFYN